MTLTMATTTALIAMALEAMTLSLVPTVLGIWVAPELLSKMSRLIIVVASVRSLAFTSIRLTSFFAT